MFLNRIRMNLSDIKTPELMPSYNRIRWKVKKKEDGETATLEFVQIFLP